MDIPVAFSGQPSSSPKARQFSRSPVLFASIQLANLNGFILNASEGGLCVQTAREIPGDDALQVRFQSMRPNSWVEARARVAWRNENKTVAGMQFIDITPEISAEIRHWLSFGTSLQELRGNWWPDEAAAATAQAMEGALLRDAAEAAAAAEATTAAEKTDAEGTEARTEEAAAEASVPQVLVEGVGRSSLLAPPSEFQGSLGKPRSPWRKRAAAAAGVGVLVAVALFAWHESFGPRSDAAAVKQTAPVGTAGQTEVRASAEAKPGPAAAAERSANRARAAEAEAMRPPQADSGLVLQVAAMSAEENARNLAAALQAKNLPAFVSRKDGDRFSRVLVGPFANEAGLGEAKKALASAGFEAIEKRWSR
jgi:cell division septation protein DedD